jgi:hypothetical protein
VTLELFAGVPVSDYARSLAWYERLLGSSPTFLATATEAVWELAEHRYIYIEERADGVGHALLTIFSMTSTGSLRRARPAASNRGSSRPMTMVYVKPPSATQTATRSASEEPLLGPSSSSCAHRHP